MEILTERLRLRELTPQDIDTITVYQSDERYLEHYPWSTRSRAESQALVERFMQWARKDPRFKFQLGITDRVDGRLFGTCGLRCNSVGSKHGDIGYELSPEYWGQGFATEAVAAMLEFGFKEIELDEIEARCVVANQRSVRLLRRLAFREVELLPPGPGLQGYTWPERYVFLLTRNQWLESTHLKRRLI